MAEVPRTANLSTNAAQGVLDFADRLRIVKELANEQAHKENVRIGKERATEVELVKDEATGITKAPEKRKLRFIGSVQDKAYNETLQAGYVAGVQNDVKATVAALSLENSENPEGFDHGLAGFRQALKENVDPSIRHEVLLGLDAQALKPRAHIEANYRKMKAQEARMEFSTLLDQETDATRKLALEGDPRATSAAQTQVQSIIEGAAAAGVISKFEAAERIKGLEQQIIQDTLTGEVQRIYQGGGLRAAANALKVLKTQTPRHLTTENHTAMIGDIFKSVKQLNDLHDIEEDSLKAEIAQAQRSNFVGLVKQQRGGALSHSDLLRAFEEGRVTLEQYEKIRARQEVHGTGVTDVAYRGYLERLQAAGEDITDEVEEASNTQLSEKDKQKLLVDQENIKKDKAKGGDSILKSDEYRALRKNVVSAIKTQPGGIRSRFVADTRSADAAHFEYELQQIASSGGDWRGFAQRTLERERIDLELKKIRGSEIKDKELRDPINKVLDVAPEEALEQLQELAREEKIDEATYLVVKDKIEGYIKRNEIDKQLEEMRGAIK